MISRAVLIGTANVIGLQGPGFAGSVRTYRPTHGAMPARVTSTRRKCIAASWQHALLDFCWLAPVTSTGCSQTPTPGQNAKAAVLALLTVN